MTSVDVVVCANRVSPFLGYALDSVRAQTHAEWTLYLVDDGSPDPQALDDAVSAVPNAVVLHRPHGGPATARNAGIRAGTGDIVTFLDDDDVWPSDRLAAAVAALERDTEAFGAYGDGVDIDEHGREFGAWASPPASADEYLRGTGALPRITTLALRRSALDRTGLFADGMYLAEDTELTLRVARHGELVHTGAVMVRYRRHGDNATSKRDWRSLHRAGRDAIARNAAAARAAGRDDQVRMLRENRRRYDRYGAELGIDAAAAHVHARRPLSALGAVGRAVATSPVGAWRGIRTRIGRARRRR